MQHRRIGVAAFVLFLTATGVARADPTDDYITVQMNDFHLPGLSLAVIKNGEIVKAEGYGLADMDRRIPATRETVYKIGSVSKQFIATAIMLLVQENRLGLDDAISKYLEGTPSSWTPIAIRHLLTHTSGLVRESPAFSPFTIRPDADLIRALHAVPLRFRPGEKWEYSNSGYVALAEIVRVVTRQPWTEYLHQSIFAPAGMNATLPTNTTADIPNRALGYTGKDNQRKADEWVALRPSGAFLSTILDLAKWDALLYTDKILSAASRRQMWTRVRLNDGTPDPYGLGWHVDAIRGRRRIWHGGGLPGFTSHFVRFMDDDLSVVVLANGDDGDVGSIANGVAALYLPSRRRK
jgi:CubicO group peptidase (beta-lactamase class C family)